MKPEPRRVSGQEWGSGVALLEERREALLAMSGPLIRPPLSGDEVIAITNRFFVAFAPFESWIPEVLAPPYAADLTVRLEGLSLRAVVYATADSVSGLPADDAVKQVRDQLSEEVAGYQTLLSRWARAAFAEAEENRRFVARVLKGRGVRDSVADVDRLVALFRENWDEVGPLVPAIDVALLNRAGGAATALKIALLDRSSKMGSPKDIKTRAYTAWRIDYGLLAATATYMAVVRPELGPLALPPLKPAKKRRPKRKARKQPQAAESTVGLLPAAEPAEPAEA